MDLSSRTPATFAARTLVVPAFLVLWACSGDPATSPNVGNVEAARASGGVSVKSTAPDSAPPDITLDVRVLGSGYDAGSKAIWAVDGDTTFATTKIRTNSTRYVSSRELVANITITADAREVLYDVVVTAAGGKHGIGIELFAVKKGLTVYRFNVAEGLQSDPTRPFYSAAKTGDPYYGGFVGDPVYLVLNAATGGDVAVCNSDGSGLDPSINTWGAYEGLWKGTFSIEARGQGPGYHVAFNATRADGTGWLWLVVNADAVKSNANLTLTFKDVRGLVSFYSTPSGSFDPRVGPFDPQDRCLSFSITATP
jgi:hypothetical protein